MSNLQHRFLWLAMANLSVAFGYFEIGALKVRRMSDRFWSQTWIVGWQRWCCGGGFFLGGVGGSLIAAGYRQHQHFQGRAVTGNRTPVQVVEALHLVEPVTAVTITP